MLPETELSRARVRGGEDPRDHDRSRFVTRAGDVPATGASAWPRPSRTGRISCSRSRRSSVRRMSACTEQAVRAATAPPGSRFPRRRCSLRRLANRLARGSADLAQLRVDGAAGSPSADAPGRRSRAVISRARRSPGSRRPRLRRWRVDVGARPLERVGALADGLVIARCAPPRRCRRGIVAARDESRDQLALELGIPARDLAQRRKSTSCMRPSVAEVAAQAVGELARHDGLAEMRVHAGGEAAALGPRS